MKTAVILTNSELEGSVDYRNEYPDCLVIGCEDHNADIDEIFSHDEDNQKVILESGFCKSHFCHFMNFDESKVDEDEKIVPIEWMPPQIPAAVNALARLCSSEQFDQIVVIGPGLEKPIEEMKLICPNIKVIQR